jgi:hypothetical protein
MITITDVQGKTPSRGRRRAVRLQGIAQVDPYAAQIVPRRRQEGMDTG